MIRRTLLPVLAALSISAATSLAQTPIWSRMNGPNGGLVSEIISDSSGNLLVGMWFGGIYESTDHGTTWHDKNEGLTNIHSAPKGIIISPDNYMYTITDAGGMFWRNRSTNDVWHRIDTTLTMGGLIALRVTSNNTVLLVTGPNGILRSTDHGATWHNSSTGITLTGQDRTIQELVTLPGYSVALLLSGKVYVSTDDAQSWTLAGAVPSQPYSMTVTTDHTIVVGGYNGEIWRSTNAGQSWDKTYQDPEGADIWAMAFNRANGAVYGFRHSGFLMRSHDNGANWEQLDSITSGGDFYPMAVDPSGNLYVGSDFDGVFRSVNDGVTLDTINDGLNANLCINAVVNPAGDVFSMVERYVFRAKANIDPPKWQQIFMMKECDIPIPNPMLWDSVGNFYIGTDLGVYKSTDNGNVWRHVLSPPTDEETFDARALALTPSGSVYLGSRLGLWQSANEGQNWRVISGPWDETTDKEVKSVVMGLNGRLYWTDYDGNIYWSDDDAFTWHQYGRQGGGVEAVQSDGTMYSSDNSHALVSTDSGVSWIVLKPAEGISIHVVKSIMLDHAENVIISTDSGIYRILHGDENYNWTAVSTGLSPNEQTRWPAISKVVEDVRHNNVFYAAGRGTGMYKSKPNMSLVKPATRFASGSLRQNFPNPFQQSTSISFTIETAGPAYLEVFDANGRTVAGKSLGTLPPGEYQTTFNGEDLPAGSYPYLVRTAADAKSGVMTIVR